MAKGYKRFEDLTVWQLARKLRRSVYQISESWPKREMYGLTAQIRDAAVSVTANITEGYGRYHYGENIQLCRIARGSLSEVLDHLYTALDQNYISQETINELYDQGREVERVLNRYINYLRRQKASRDKKSRKTVKEASSRYELLSKEFNWEGGVEWVYDFETGFDKDWST